MPYKVEMDMMKSRSGKFVNERFSDVVLHFFIGHRCNIFQ